jgi:ketosteroid isomerase-like protein
MLTDHSEFAAAVRALDVSFARHANAGEVDQLVAACYADNALVLPPNAPLVQGRGQIGELFREMIETGAGDVVRQTSPLHVAGDLGYGIGTYSFAIRHPGRELDCETGKHLLVYRRQANDAWQVAIDMFCSDLPPPDRA